MGETAKVMDQAVKAMVDREGMGMEWYRMRNSECGIKKVKWKWEEACGSVYQQSNERG